MKRPKPERPLTVREAVAKQRTEKLSSPGKALSLTQSLSLINKKHKKLLKKLAE